LDTFLNNRDGLANKLHLQAEKLLEDEASARPKQGKSAQKINEFLRGELGAVGLLHTLKS
jgi:hypothetical protein